jgi:hypothetical protein
MPEDTSPKTAPSKKAKEELSSPPASPAPVPDSPQVEEVHYSSYDEAVTAFLNEVAQLASSYLDAELIGMVTIVAVSADGKYSQSHEVSKLPESAGEDKQEQARIHRMNASSRLQTAMELQKHKTRLLGTIRNLISEIDA